LQEAHSQCLCCPGAGINSASSFIFLMLIFKGEEGDNEYGQDPIDNPSPKAKAN